MLVIRRRPGETVVIGEDVEIEVLEISGNQVKVGIRAPREILVLRKEVQLTRTQNRAAARHLSNSPEDTKFMSLSGSPIRVL